MRCTTQYGANSYGNSADAPRYTVELTQPDSHSVSIHFEFERPALGQGRGDSVGLVRSLRLNMPRDVAVRLAQGMGDLLDDVQGEPVRLDVDECPGSDSHEVFRQAMLEAD